MLNSLYLHPNKTHLYSPHTKSTFSSKKFQLYKFAFLCKNCFKMHKSKCMGKKAQLSENMGIATEMFDECHSQAIFCHLKCVVCPSVFFPLTDKQGLPMKKLNWQTDFTPNITDQPRILNWPKSGAITAVCCYKYDITFGVQATGQDCLCIES